MSVAGLHPLHLIYFNYDSLQTPAKDMFEVVSSYGIKWEHLMSVYSDGAPEMYG